LPAARSPQQAECIGVAGGHATGRMHNRHWNVTPVFEWLFPVLEQIFRKKLARCGCRYSPRFLAFDALPALLPRRGKIWWWSSGSRKSAGREVVELFDYKAVFVGAEHAPVGKEPFVEAGRNFRGRDAHHLSGGTHTFLMCSASADPRQGSNRWAIRQVELDGGDPVAGGIKTEACSVAPRLGRARSENTSNDYVTRSLTETRAYRRLYASVREDDLDKPFMSKLAWSGRRRGAKAANGPTSTGCAVRRAAAVEREVFLQSHRHTRCGLYARQKIQVPAVARNGGRGSAHR